MKHEFEFQYNRKYFEEIYFRNHQKNYIKNDLIKWKFVYFTVSLIVILLIYVFIKHENNKKDYLILMTIISVFLAINYLTQVLKLRKWKKLVFNFLDKTDKIKSHKVILTDDYFSIIQDSNETIEKWNNFTSANIFENYIILVSTENYMIPKKSLSNHEFSILKKVIPEKIRNSKTKF